MEIIRGNILDAEGVICHQCNCVTTRSKGLSEAIFNRFKFADVYSDGTKRDVGTNCIRASPDPNCKTIVVNMFAQKNPGKPTFLETEQMRLQFFRSCLEELGVWLKERNIDTVSFPYKIGCGLAGGNWEDYEEALFEFSKDFRIKIYHL